MCVRASVCGTYSNYGDASWTHPQKIAGHDLMSAHDMCIQHTPIALKQTNTMP